jgi:hypothetical protein
MKAGMRNPAASPVRRAIAAARDNDHLYLDTEQQKMDRSLALYRDQLGVPSMRARSSTAGHFWTNDT